MPSAFLLYLLQAHAVLLLFAAGYFGLLRRLTFFTLNRAYLAFALLFAAGYPALPVPALWPAAPGPAVAWALAALPAAATAPLPAPGPGWPALLLAGYAAGAALLLGRLLVQLLSLARLHRAARPAVAPGGTPYRRLTAPDGPFSFGRTIYLNPDQHPAPAELAAVLRHEQAHVRQAHTLDVLLAQLALAFFWANPAAWLLRRAVLDNLEYLADQAALRTGLERRAYQYQLLRLRPGVGGPALVSPFSFLTLKNRVLMMNQPASARLQLLRYVVAGPLVVALALGYSAAQAQTAAPAPTATAADKPLPTDVVYYVDGKQVDVATVSALNPKEFESMNVLQGPSAQALSGKAAGGKAILITTRANAKTPAVRAFNKKYNGVSFVAPAVAPEPGSEAPISNVAAPALAYITKNYPDSRITGVTAMKNAETGQSNFRVEIAIGRRPQYLVFDARGQFVSK